MLYLQEAVAHTEVFHVSKGGAARMAKDMQVPFLGRVSDPLQMRIVACSRVARTGECLTHASDTTAMRGLPDGDNAWLLWQCTELRSCLQHPLSLLVSTCPPVSSQAPAAGPS